MSPTSLVVALIVFLLIDLTVQTGKADRYGSSDKAIRRKHSHPSENKNESCGLSGRNVEVASAGYLWWMQQKKQWTAPTGSQTAVKPKIFQPRILIDDREPTEIAQESVQTPNNNNNDNMNWEMSWPSTSEEHYSGKKVGFPDTHSGQISSNVPVKPKTFRPLVLINRKNEAAEKGNNSCNRWFRPWETNQNMITAEEIGASASHPVQSNKSEEGLELGSEEITNEKEPDVNFGRADNVTAQLSILGMSTLAENATEVISDVSPTENCQQVKTNNKLQSLARFDKNKLAPKAAMPTMVGFSSDSFSKTYVSKRIPDGHQRAVHQGCNGTRTTLKYDSNIGDHERMQREQSKRFPCSNCNKTFSRISNLYKHQRGVHEASERIPCSYCNMTLKYKGTLVLHRKEQHEASERIPCLYCNITFLRRSNLNKHQRAKHQGSEKIQCSYCNKTYKYKSTLSIHQRAEHEGSNGTQCPHCNEIFKYKYALTRHIRVEHEQSERIVCSYCNMTFKYETNLYAHQRGVHEASERIPCSYCNKTFKYKYTLTRHIRVEHEQSERIVCSYCNMTFKYETNLYKHRRQVHEASERILCSYCNKTYKYKSDLAVHRKEQHEASERISCLYCNVTFLRRSNLNKHQRVKHQGSEKIQCSYCNKTYKYKSTLSVHQRAEHEVSNGSQCPHCNEIFKYKYALTCHIRKLHPTLNITQSKRSSGTAGQEDGPPSKRRKNEEKIE